MRYVLYDGGDGIDGIQERFARGFSNDYGPVEPTGHHKTRYHVLENHIDTQSRQLRGNWEAALNEGSGYPLKVEDGDEIVSHLLGSGWVIQSVVVHNQRPSSGVITPSIELIEGKTFKGSAAVDLSKVGHSRITFPGLTDVSLITDHNGFLVWSYKAATVKEDAKKEDKDRMTVPDPRFDMCGSIFLELVNFNSEFTCDCAPWPCNTEFPTPQCEPNL